MPSGLLPGGRFRGTSWETLITDFFSHRTPFGCNYCLASTCNMVCIITHAAGGSDFIEKRIPSHKSHIHVQERSREMIGKKGLIEKPSRVVCISLIFRLVTHTHASARMKIVEMKRKTLGLVIFYAVCFSTTSSIFVLGEKKKSEQLLQHQICFFLSLLFF